MCNVAGLGVGREVFLALDAGLLDDLAFVDELGHTFGLRTRPARAVRRGCRIIEYGDPLSPMGAGGTDFTALEKLELGWISSVQRVDRSGAYAVADVDAPNSLPQALVVPTGVGEYWVERRATSLVVRLVRPNDPADPVYLRSIFLARSEGRYVARGVFSITAQFAFSWLDKKRPSVPRARALDHAYLSWTRSADRDSGVAEYRVTVDRRPLATTTDTGIALPPLPEGGHRITVVAIDRASNRSRPGVVSLHV